MSGVSVTVTACDRLDLLERTIRSFLKYNTYPIENFLIRDDSGLMDVWEKTSELMKLVPYKWSLLPIGQVGQAKSIDLMIKKVKTRYVFHLEDDWEFDRPGFIEDCFEVMDTRTSQVRVRHRDDGSATQTVPYNSIADRCINHLFSFNPHLRRTDLISKFEGTNETILGQVIERIEFKTLWLKEGACRHIGGEKTTNRPGTPYAAGVKKA
jgi:Glycosyl transferase family 2